MISPQWIEEIEWAAARIKINATCDQIESGPEYRSEIELTDERERQLWLHFQK